MKTRLAVIAIVVTWGGALLELWRRHPRTGAGLINRLVNPRLVRANVATASRGEIALVEHVGRKTGTVRITPVHPVRTEHGFRIIVPLGRESHWARNVLAAGHCRLLIGDAIHELDEPSLVEPADVAGVPGPVARVMAWLGFRYLQLHELAPEPSALEALAPDAAPDNEPARKPTHRSRRRLVAEPAAAG